MHELAFSAMGCQMLAVLDAQTPDADAALAAVPSWFAEWEQVLSRFRVDSELSQLNALAGRPVTVSATLYAVVDAALRAARQSAGLVRPTVLNALETSGYDRTFAALRPDEALPPPALGPSPDWRAIRLEPASRTVRLPAGVRLDLGGVAKGWAAEQAARRLAASGPALIDAGGDIAVSGPIADGSPWPIAVADPRAPDRSLGLINLAHGAVATSGRDYRQWRRGGALQHHIIDPRTGRPAVTDVLTATVIGPDALSAEVAAKVALIRGSRDGLAWLESRGDLAGLLVLEDGRVARNRRMDSYLEQEHREPVKELR